MGVAEVGVVGKREKGKRKRGRRKRGRSCLGHWAEKGEKENWGRNGMATAERF